MGKIAQDLAKHGFNANELATLGLSFNGARGWYDRDKAAQLAQDAALTTTPNAAVPVELTAFIDPQAVEILFAPRNASEVFSETKKGNWTTPYFKKRIEEVAGRTQPYSDFAENGVSDTNANWKAREQYIFQTVIQAGDLETAVSGAALIDFVAGKQRAASTIIAIDSNKFYLLGVAGKEIYGILNDPSLPAAIVPLSNGASSPSVLWADKSTVQIYNDVLALFAELVRQSSGLITNATPLILEMSPELSVYLGSATNFNVSVLDMLNKYFRSLKIVTLPELSSLAAGETMFLVAPEIAGTPSAELCYGEKTKSLPWVRELSAMKQKWVSTTYGGVVWRPFAFAQMTGM